jgi:hypothetical protein
MLRGHAVPVHAGGQPARRRIRITPPLACNLRAPPPYRVEPLAVTNGSVTLDTQVPPSLHHQPVKAALAGNPRATISVCCGANHLFRRARTGQVAE